MILTSITCNQIVVIYWKPILKYCDLVADLVAFIYDRFHSKQVAIQPILKRCGLAANGFYLTCQVAGADCVYVRIEDEVRLSHATSTHCTKFAGCLKLEHNDYLVTVEI